MISEIRNELRVLKHEFFTGHVKFGIEHGKVTNLYISTLRKDETIPAARPPDFDELLRKICSDNYFGTVEYDLNSGNILNLTYSTVFSGTDLQNLMRENKCKYVRIVAVKSSI